MPAGRPGDASFDLVISSAAFHWIEPDVAFSKSARLLRLGGWLALLGAEERYGAGPLTSGPAAGHADGDPAGSGPPAGLEGSGGSNQQHGDATAELAGLAGLGLVRERLGPLIALAGTEAARRHAGVTLRPSWKNLAFAGAAGTGKSRVAAVLARIYQQADLLSRGHLTEVSRAELSAERPSDTAGLVHEAVRRALGGGLLISDAHLAGESPAEDAHAIRLLTEQMTGHRDGDLIVIVAGPEAQLRQFLAATPGLASRIAETIVFPPYEPGELTEIFASRARQAGFTLTSDATARAAAVLGAGPGFGEAGSARLATRLLNRAAAAQARRVMRGSGGPDELTVLTAADIPDPGDRPGPADGPADPIAALEQMIGLHEVKLQVRQLAAEARAEKLRRDAGMPARPVARHGSTSIRSRTAR